MEEKFDFAVYGLVLRHTLLITEGRENMHQALYRKWRPKTFDEVYGQDHITSILKYEVSNSKFSHAYLFCGSRGTGKTTCAKILAKAVNCLHSENGDPCGKCEACRAIDSGSATDVLEMDAASNNGVDNIRDIRDEVVYSPSNLKYRVYIIDEVHMLSTSAFNALLKTLEEPPEHVVFILATTELHKLPATIISRCQRFDFRRISTEVLKNHLMRIAEKEDIQIDESAAVLLAKHAQGGMRDAISLLELCASSRQKIDNALVASTIGSSGREDMLAVVKAIAEKDYEAIFSAVDEVVRSSRDITVFWQELISVYRDLLVVKSSKEPSVYLDLTDSETEALVTLSKAFSIELLSYHCGMLQEALVTMLKANAVRRIVAELTLVRMCDERLVNSSEAMLSRISALEKAVSSGAVIAPVTKKSDGQEQTSSRQKSRANAKASLDDDEMFRSDAPVASKATDQKKEKTVQSVSSGDNVRTLRPFKSKAEAMELMGRRNPMLSSFFKGAKWYTDGNGCVVLKFATQFNIDNVKTFGGEQFFLDVISEVIGKRFSASDVRYECDGEKKDNAIIDEIIEAAEQG